MKLENGLEIERERKDGKICVYDPLNGRSVLGDNVKATVQLFYDTYYAPVVEKYKNVDIDKLLKYNQLIEIYQAFTCACTKGIPVWIDRNNDFADRAKSKGASIRELCERLEEEQGALRFKQIFLRK